MAELNLGIHRLTRTSAVSCGSQQPITRGLAFTGFVAGAFWIAKKKQKDDTLLVAKHTFDMLVSTHYNVIIYRNPIIYPAIKSL